MVLKYHLLIAVSLLYMQGAATMIRPILTRRGMLGLFSSFNFLLCPWILRVEASIFPLIKSILKRLRYRTQEPQNNSLQWP